MRVQVLVTVEVKKPRDDCELANGEAKRAAVEAVERAIEYADDAGRFQDDIPVRLVNVA